MKESMADIARDVIDLHQENEQLREAQHLGGMAHDELQLACEQLQETATTVVEHCYLPCDQTLQCGACGVVWWNVPEEDYENWHAEGCPLFAAEVALGRSVNVRRGPAPEGCNPWVDPTNGGKAKAIRASYDAAVASVAQLRADLEKLDGEHQRLVTRLAEAEEREERLARATQRYLTHVDRRERCNENSHPHRVRAGTIELAERDALDACLRATVDGAAR